MPLYFYCKVFLSAPKGALLLLLCYKDFQNSDASDLNKTVNNIQTDKRSGTYTNYNNAVMNVSKVMGTDFPR